MKKYLLPENGSFYKANLHCHSTLSDGALSPEEIKELYKKKGYSVVAYTDHNILIPHDDLNDDDFLALNGFEADLNENIAGETDWRKLKCVHFCAIALDRQNITQPCWSRRFAGIGEKNADLVKFDENEPEYERVYTGEKVSEMMQKCREKGFFITYNHPTWSVESYNEYMSYSGMHAMEMFNGGCLVAGYDDYNPRVYDDMLQGGKKIFCIGADDNHNHADKASRRYDSGIAFTMIKADSLDYRAITQALENGDFYASEAPEIYELYTENGKAYIKTSEADRIQCNYGKRMAAIEFDETGSGIFEACFDVPSDCGYFRITVTDKSGKHACTNAYFV